MTQTVGDNIVIVSVYGEQKKIIYYLYRREKEIILLYLKKQYVARESYEDKVSLYPNFSLCLLNISMSLKSINSYNIIPQVRITHLSYSDK